MPEGSEGLLKGPKGLPEGPVGLPEGPEGLLEGPVELPGGPGGDGQMYIWTEFLPILQDFVPCRNQCPKRRKTKKLPKIAQKMTKKKRGKPSS